MNELLALLDGREVGTVRYERGRLSFVYADAWRSAPDAYPDIDPQKGKLAMKVGDEYRLRDIGFSEWRKLAADVRVDGDALVGRARAMAAELPDRLADEVRKLGDAGLAHPVISALADVLSKRAVRSPASEANYQPNRSI